MSEWPGFESKNKAYLTAGWALYIGNEISHNLCLRLKGHDFTSLISVFGEKGPSKFSHKGNLLAFGEVAITSAHPERGCF